MRTALLLVVLGVSVSCSSPQTTCRHAGTLSKIYDGYPARIVTTRGTYAVYGVHPPSGRFGEMATTCIDDSGTRTICLDGACWFY